MSDRITIRSYARVFRLDRRLYRVDRWLLPVPGGVPLRGCAYFASALLAILILGKFPVIGLILDVIPAPFRYFIIPLGAAVIGAQLTPDGRLPHRWALSWLAMRLRPRRMIGRRKVPVEGDVKLWGGKYRVIHDELDPDLHKARIHGPTRIVFNVPVKFRMSVLGRGWVVRHDPDGRTGPYEVVDRLEVR